ncbi:hypothetical protein MGN01_06820 [Methylobacterium gnaphalii]|uniref:N-acetyltransferase domain-containing protein n=1 Tax=Methylobacterium gnaphalii TaxID=1010610 RepID=A0A512JFV8_9HYPH|nr:hypothetical protein MGN01_06820 [Methylobacterium gnaphalii]GLS47602.1 hypothetical protein GCM10007885_04460 [Methylobacterium gnaphalii]
MESQAPPVSDGLRPIPDGGLDEAIPVLRRGFPDRDRRFWERGFARLGAARRSGPLGYLLRSRGEDVGVLLTFRSERLGREGRTATVNLAGWYVAPGHRWQAPMMLRRVVTERETVFTDLTPSTSVERLNTALGFETCNEGRVVTFLPPWAALPSPSGAGVVGLNHPAAAQVAEGDLLERHEALGCVAAVLREGDRVSPLLFRVAPRMGIRHANLIYADSRQGVLANRAAIARFLVARGVLALTVDGDRADCPRGSLFRTGRCRFRKGGLDRDRIDYAFSELVLLDLDT